MTDTVVLKEESLIAIEDLTADTVDHRRFYTIEECNRMDDSVLEELFRGLEYRAFYDQAYEDAQHQTYPNTDITDEHRLDILDQLELLHAGDPPKIPLKTMPDGSIAYVDVSDRVVDAVTSNIPIETPKVKEKRSTPKWILAVIPIVALVAMCGVFTLVLNLSKGGDVTDADLTSTANADALAHLDPDETPTPTPLAVNNIDRPIEAGDAASGYFPVLLEIEQSNSESRVFPVSVQAVEVAEWKYDRDPDVASCVQGHVIRSVCGIPYTDSNGAFLGNLEPGSKFIMRMNTSQELHFQVTHSERVPRQEASIFSQNQTGFSLILLDDPNPDRLVIFADYVASQEVFSNSLLVSDTARPGVAVAHGDKAEITLLNSNVSDGPANAPLAAGWQYLLVDLQFNTLMQLDTSLYSFELTDGMGNLYSPITVDPSIVREAPFSHTLLDSNIQWTTTIGFLVPDTIVGATLSIWTQDTEEIVYDVAYEPHSAFTVDHLYITLNSVETTTETDDEPAKLSMTVRLYNDTDQPIIILPNEIYIVYSDFEIVDQFPIGPHVTPVTPVLPLTIQPGEALDVALEFLWNEQSHVGLALGGYQFIAQLQ